MHDATHRWLATSWRALRFRPLLLRLAPLFARQNRAGAIPHFLKQRIIREYASRLGIRTLVETGTYMGDMVWAMRDHFDEIFSIELDKQLHSRASHRFKNNPHVHLYQGDSTSLLGDVILGLRGPAIFWLDGHYSGGATAKGDSETPVLAELRHVLSDSDKHHVVLIDDARLFTGEADWPSVADLQSLIVDRPGLSMELADDVIRIVPAL